MSDKPPKTAVWGVVLELPGDVLDTLEKQGAVYGRHGYWWFDYHGEGQTVCVPINKKK
jgi:hypothetical protein